VRLFAPHTSARSRSFAPRSSAACAHVHSRSVALWSRPQRQPSAACCNFQPPRRVLHAAFVVQGVCCTRHSWCKVFAARGIRGARCVLHAAFVVQGVCCTRHSWCKVCVARGIRGARCVLHAAFVVQGLCSRRAARRPARRRAQSSPSQSARTIRIAPAARLEYSTRLD
jgi:hypothetical protein